MGDSTLGLGDFPQTVGIGAVAGTHHQKHLALARELLRRVLTVLGGVADVILARPLDLRKRRRRASMICAVSSMESVVWVT